MNASDAITGSSKIAIVEVVVVKRSEFCRPVPDRRGSFCCCLPAAAAAALLVRVHPRRSGSFSRVFYELTSLAYPLRIYYRNLGTGTGTGTPE